VSVKGNFADEQGNRTELVEILCACRGRIHWVDADPCGSQVMFS